MDIRTIARMQLMEAGATHDSHDLARAVLEMIAALQTIASVPGDTHEPLQITCSTIAGTTLEKWTGENWVGGAGGFDAPFPRPTNRSPSGTDKGA